jgi:hypothetical protein
VNVGQLLAEAARGLERRTGLSDPPHEARWLLALYARRHQPSPPSSALMRATWIAAGSSVVTDVAALYAGLAEGWAMTVALVAATLAARVWVTAAARRGA